MTSESDRPDPVPAEPAPTAPATEAAAEAPAPAPAPPPEKKKETIWSFLRFLLILFVATVILRSCIVAPFSIPSGSMIPNLLIGDYLFVAKWPYGYSQHSFPFGIIRYDGRIFERLPERGDIVVFRHPGTGDDWVKRVIALPGDTIAVQGGQLILNGQPVQRERIEDFVLPVTENMFRQNSRVDPCHLQGPAARETRDGNGQEICVYPRFRETLPGGRSYEVLDQGQDPSRRSVQEQSPVGRDNVEPFRVPDGVVFVMGDNRDDSLDSRFPVEQGGVGLLPIDNIEGRAFFSFFSTDGSAEWLLPWTWFTAARWSRIGHFYP